MLEIKRRAMPCMYLSFCTLTIPTRNSGNVKNSFFGSSVKSRHILSMSLEDKVPACCDDEVFILFHFLYKISRIFFHVEAQDCHRLKPGR